MPLEVTVLGRWWQLLPVEDKAFGNCRESWEEIGASSPRQLGSGGWMARQGT